MAKLTKLAVRLNKLSLTPQPFPVFSLKRIPFYTIVPNTLEQRTKQKLHFISSIITYWLKGATDSRTKTVAQHLGRGLDMYILSVAI